MNQNNILQNSEYFVVLFSKYSNACKKFADTVNNGNLNLNFNYLCVDNKDVRNRILSSTDIEIKQVPCLLVINEKSGSIDKYEGQDSFIWINDIIQRKQKKLLEEQMRQQAMIQQQMQQQKEIQQKLAEREVDQSVKPIKKIKASSSKKKTMIEDIDENGKPTIIITEKNHNMKPIKINPIIYKLLLDCNEVILNCNVDIINHLPDNIETIQLGEILYYEYKSIEKYPQNLKKIIILAAKFTRGIIKPYIQLITLPF